MGKLFKLKEWLTVEEAARHLSNILTDNVTEADVLRLALDGRLQLSVRFVNHAMARPGRLVPIAEAKYQEVPSLKGTGTVRLYGGPTLFTKGVETHVALLENTFAGLSGVYDLPMIGNERLDIERRYENITGGPIVDWVGLDGAFVVGHDGQLCQIQERFSNSRQTRSRSDEDNYYPAGGLPPDSVLVVRTAALTDLERRIQENDNSDADKLAEKSLSTRERHTLLCMLAVACKEAKIDYTKASKAAGVMQKAADGMGLNIGETTIEEHFKKIPDALDKRTKLNKQ